MSTPSLTPVRIVHVADYTGPYRGSFIPMLLAVLDRVRERGWKGEVVFCPTARDGSWLPEFAERRIPVRFVDPFPRANAARTLHGVLAAESTATIVHTHFTSYDVASAWATRRLPHVRLVWHVHEFSPTALAGRSRRYAKFLLARHHLTAVMCVGVASVDDLRGTHVLPADRLVHVPNAVDVAAFPLVDAEARRSARQSLGLKQDVPVVLHFGRDWLLKGGDVFVRAIANLVRSGVVLQAVTVWAGEDGRADAAHCGVDDVVGFFPAADDVRQLYAAADIFVSCSRHEGDSFAILEALSSGLGVVVAPPGDASSGVPSRRFVELDPHEVAQGIQSLLRRSAEDVAADGLLTRAWAEHTIGLQAYADRTVALYERIIAGEPPNA